MSADNPDQRTFAQEMTRFLNDPSAVLDAATADPTWEKDPAGTFDRHLAAKGYSEAVRKELAESFAHLDDFGAELLKAIGLPE